MSEVSERYKKWAELLTEKIRSVPSDAWENQSPCPDWTTRGVVAHLVNSSNHFLGYVDRRISDLPSVDADPLGAWLAVRMTIEAVLNDDELANKQYETPMGPSTFVEGVDMYLCLDLVVHAWDIARAAGVDETLDLAAVQELRPRAEQIADIGRQMGAFGPAIDVRDNADEQTQLLAILGRDSQK